MFAKKVTKVPRVRTFDEGFEWLIKNGWDIVLTTFLFTEFSVQHKTHGTTMKIRGTVPLDMVNEMLDKIYAHGFHLLP